MNRNGRFAVAAALLVGTVAYLMYTGVTQTSVYYLTIDEFLVKKDALANEGVRVAGRVQEGSVTRRMTNKGEELNFRLAEFKGQAAGDSVAVHYVGVTPDMFKSEGGTDVIVEGKYVDGTLRAHNLLTSCPSKYEAENGAAEASGPRGTGE
jgi:cytochrome c-type biogenesis protein CcmE